MLRTMIMAVGTMSAVSLAAIGTKDTVTTDPAQPTTKDAVTFHLFNYNSCCCAAYTEQNLASSNTAIMLSYTVDVRPCLACMCLMAGSTVSFTGGPFKAGTYGVYKVEDPCPPDMICIQVLPMPVLVGKVTVSGTTAATVPAIANAPTRNRMDPGIFAVDMRGRVTAQRGDAGSGVCLLGRATRGGLRVTIAQEFAH